MVKNTQVIFSYIPIKYPILGEHSKGNESTISPEAYISLYNRINSDQRLIFGLFQVSSKSLTVQGFIASNSPEVTEHFRKKVTKRIQSGQIQYREAKCFENTSQATLDDLTGKNFEKQVIKVADL